MRSRVEKGDVLGWTLSTGDPSNIPTEFTSVYPACAPSAIPTELKSVEPKRENIDKTYFVHDTIHQLNDVVHYLNTKRKNTLVDIIDLQRCSSLK